MQHHQKKLEHINNGEDRLSSLPDNLLITILSLLPFDSTVATSVLSRRWRHLWTHSTHISFYCFRKIQIINDVIFKLTSPKFHTFHLYLPYFADEHSSILIPCFEFICSRNPEVFIIRSINCHKLRLLLPFSLLRTQSLVELELCRDFGFDFANDQMVINLPNLKKLCLFLGDSNRGLLRTLFKSCPMLEHLVLNLDLNEKDHHVDVLAPNLKFLTIYSRSKNCLLIIDAPKLAHLKTGEDDPSLFYHFVNNLKCLQEAEIIFPEHGVGDENDYHAKILALFQGISCVKSLTLHQFFSFHLPEFALPIFHNLVHLSFSGCMLGTSSIWVPSCLLSNVKSLKITPILPDEHHIRLMEHILSNATVLELLQVEHHDDLSISHKTRVYAECKFAMKLFQLPRSSSKCQIELDGVIISASSKDISYGKLTCELHDPGWNWDSESDSDLI